MFELHAGAAIRLRYKSHINFGGQRHTGIRLPLRIDFPAHDELFSWLPYTHVPDDRLCAVLETRVPPTADKRLDCGLLDGRLANALRLWPPAINVKSKYFKSALGGRLDVHGFTNRSNSNG